MPEAKVVGLVVRFLGGRGGQVLSSPSSAKGKVSLSEVLGCPDLQEGGGG